MSLAKGRAKRSKAGNRMSRILNEEEEDEFYSTTYGGFKDADDDEEYRQEKEEADVVDSDFDIDEDDAPASDQDEDGDQKKRSRRLVTRAYKEPKAKEPPQKKSGAATSKKVSRTLEIKEEIDEDSSQSRRTRRSSMINKSPSPAPGRGRVTRHSIRVDSESTSEADVTEQGTETAGPSSAKRTTRKRKLSESEMPDFTPKPLEEVPRPTRQVVRPSLSSAKRVQFSSSDKKGGRTTMRSSTKQKSIETEKRIKIREKESDKRKKILLSRKVEYEMPTQEELLEETKWTEIVNLESLAQFQQMELEKKKLKPVRNVPTGPVIRYHSVTMPKVKLASENDEERKKKLIEVLAEGEEKPNAPPLPKLPNLDEEGPELFERTFITFTDDNLFKQAFDRPAKPTKAKERYCALTRLKTPYFDPVLQLPYYNSDVFKILRAAYHRILYHRGDRRIPQVRKYCDWLEVEYPHLFNKGKLQKLAASDSDHGSRRGLKRKMKAGAEGKKGMAKKPSLDTDAEGEAPAEPAVNPAGTDDKIKPQVPETPPATPGPSTSAELIAQEMAKKRSSQFPNWRDIGFSRPKNRPLLSMFQSPFTITPSTYRPPSSRIQGLRKPERPPTALPNILRPKTLSPTKTSNVKIPLASSMYPLKTYPAKGTPVTPQIVATRPQATIASPAPISVVQSPVYSPRQVLLAKRNIGSPGLVTPTSLATSIGAVTGAMNKGGSILIRAGGNTAQLQPTSFQQLPGTTLFGMTGATPTGTLQLGNTQLPLTLVSFSRAGGGVPAVIRGTSLNANMANNQVVRLLQSQKIQILQQPLVSAAGLLTNQTGATGMNIPVTLRLPAPTTQVPGSPQASSPAACSTASAIVAANTAVRLARSAATGAQQIVPRPTSATTTVVARSSPITATGLAGPRLIKTSPGSPGIRQAGVRALTVSQLKAVLAATTGQSMIRSGTPTTIISASGQQRTVSTITPGVRAISGVTGIRTAGSATTMASTMLRPVTIPTAGMRTLNPNTGVIGIRSTLVSPGGTRLVGVHTGVRGPQTASALVAASGRNIRFAPRLGVTVTTSPGGGPPRQTLPPPLAASPLAGGPPPAPPVAVPSPSTPVVPKESPNVAP